MNVVRVSDEANVLYINIHLFPFNFFYTLLLLCLHIFHIKRVCCCCCCCPFLLVGTKCSVCIRLVGLMWRLFSTPHNKFKNKSIAMWVDFTVHLCIYQTHNNVSECVCVFNYIIINILFSMRSFTLTLMVFYKEHTILRLFYHIFFCSFSYFWLLWVPLSVAYVVYFAARSAFRCLLILWLLVFVCILLISF